MISKVDYSVQVSEKLLSENAIGIEGERTEGRVFPFRKLGVLGVLRCSAMVSNLAGLLA